MGSHTSDALVDAHSCPAEKTIGNRYELRTPIGSGGMGTVWRAYDDLLCREIAVKEVLVHDDLPEQERSMLCERTLREARAAARLDHSSVIRVFDVVHEENRPWIIMELLESESLADAIKHDERLPVLQTAEIGLSVLAALEAAHRAGILHRDIKPGNVLLCENGRIVLTDFGVARSPNETPLTSTGLLLGSPQYIAPERARGRPFGPPSDLFSLGATMYAALEGRPPFDRGDPIGTMTAVVTAPPDSMPHAGSLEEVLLGLMEKDPQDRWNAERTRKALRRIIRAEKHAATDGKTQETRVPTQRSKGRHSAENDKVAATERPSRTPPTAPTIVRSGKHRNRNNTKLSAIARPLLNAAEATVSLVSTRKAASRHSSAARARHSSDVLPEHVWILGVLGAFAISVAILTLWLIL